MGRLVLFVFREGSRGGGKGVVGLIPVVVEGEELVVFVLGDVVVFVVVATGAGQGEAEPGRAGCLEAVHDCGYAPLFLVGAALGVGQRLPVKGGGQTLFRGGLGKKVAGQLLDRELVVGKIFVDGLDHPVAITPGVGTCPVFLVSVRIRVTGYVEPVASPSLPEMRRGKQFFHQVGVGISGLVLDELIDAGRVGRQPEQVVMQTLGECSPVGLGRGCPIETFQLGEHEAINWILNAFFVFQLGERRGEYRSIGPMNGIVGTFADPLLEHVDVFLGQ